MAQPQAVRERGLVTLEIAFGTIGLAALVYLLIGLFGIAVMQVRCVDAASDLTRQAARGDVAAVLRITDDLPGVAVVTRSDAGDMVRVRLDITFRPWGSWLMPITVTAESETRREGGVP
ncbi:MAG: hypothetical protein LBK42_13415 [Propionibacteriaceae bacterium]|jgi:hypothetical protein|nr:hypothetical protein [Propionibacteriaceae bacterium]